MNKENDVQEQETTTTIVGDWRMVTQTAADGTVLKFMNQRGVDGKNKQEIFQIGFQHDVDKKETTVELLLPLGVTLTEQVAFGIEGEEPYIATYQSCFTEGCLATASVDNDLEKKFGKVEKGYIEFTHTSGGHAKFPFSLNGFAAGFKELKSA